MSKSLSVVAVATMFANATGISVNQIIEVKVTQFDGQFDLTVVGQKEILSYVVSIKEDKISYLTIVNPKPISKFRKIINILFKGE